MHACLEEQLLRDDAVSMLNNVKYVFSDKNDMRRQ